MIVRRAILPAILALVLLVGCGDDGVSPRHERFRPEGTYIGHQIIIDRSMTVEPIEYSHDPFGPYTWGFDLSDVLELGQHYYNDIELQFLTPTTCMQDVAVYNVAGEHWDKIGFNDPNERYCGRALTRWHYLFSARNFAFNEYLDDTDRMTLWSELILYSLFMRALKYDPDYIAFPTPYSPVNGKHLYSGLTYHRRRLIASSAGAGKMYTMNTDGAITDDIDSPVPDVISIAHDGDHLWLLTSMGRIVRTHLEGNVLGGFETGIDDPGCIGWGAGDFWLMDLEWPNRHVYRIDADLSSARGVMACTDTIVFPYPLQSSRDHGVTGTARHMIFACDGTLYIYDPQRRVFEDMYQSTVYGVQDMTWDGDMLWVLHGGPVGYNYGQYISPFKFKIYR